MDEVITVTDASSSLRSYSSDPFVNLPLLSAFLACALAQFLKPFIAWVREKRWDSRRMVSSGGMPLSHSAFVTTLTAAIGLQEGTGGSTFAIAVVLTHVVECMVYNSYWVGVVVMRHPSDPMIIAWFLLGLV
ncbi:hypothetical protein TEA_008823 [Camellia sinensis var. sinensis]|uniref:Uncharacterized protein n=1 Tax=Camellia sinensis var. sinensis TaxID=542762 RepID=A0A4S4DLV8_CAMSN|nr:hypothetical protein TEA_008823 [Camellia sinensis var. sinensis]